MPSWFRFLTLLAFMIFQEENVECAIFEVGIGGRLDSTNVLINPAVCGITLLDYDHVEVLGDSLEEIAYEKAGIIKRGTPVISVPQEASSLKVLQERARELASPFYLARPDLQDLIDITDKSKLFTQSIRSRIDIKAYFMQSNASLSTALADVWFRRSTTSRNFIGIQNPKWRPEKGFLDPISPILPISCKNYTNGQINNVIVSTHINNKMDINSICDISQSNISNMNGSFNNSLVNKNNSIPSFTSETKTSDSYTYYPIFPINEETICGLTSFHWPGRAQVISCGNLIIYLDGAHTPLSIKACVKWFLNARLDRKADISSVFFNCNKPRNPKTLLIAILDIFIQGESIDCIFFTTSKILPQYRYDSSNDISYRNSNDNSWQHEISKTWNELVETVHHSNKAIKLPSIHVVSNINEGLDFLELKYPEKKIEILATGSIYLVGAFLELFKYSTCEK